MNLENINHCVAEEIESLRTDPVFREWRIRVLRSGIAEESLEACQEVRPAFRCGGEFSKLSSTRHENEKKIMNDLGSKRLFLIDGKTASQTDMSSVEPEEFLRTRMARALLDLRKIESFRQFLQSEHLKHLEQSPKGKGN